MNYTEQQFNDLVTQFTARELPKAKWTHEAHILVAFWHTSKYNENDALAKIRQAIRDYNTSVGTVNSDSSGYHETLTVLWLKIVRYYLSLATPQPLIDTINQFIAGGNADKTLPLQFYSNELLFSKKARQQWIGPDKTPLESIPEIVKRPAVAHGKAAVHK